MVSTIPLVSFLITLLLASAECFQGIQINDTDGNPVMTQELYYIQPVTGGGLYPGSAWHPSCPLGISQAVVNKPGDPVRFGIILPSPSPFPFPVPGPVLPPTIVDTHTEITIEFKYVNRCNEFSKYWGVDVSPPATEEPAIIVGAEPTSPNSLFQIRIAGENIYELATRSGPVGLFPSPPYNLGVDGQLVVSTNDTTKSFFVKFKKVNVDATMATRVEKLRLRMFPFY